MGTPAWHPCVNNDQPAFLHRHPGLLSSHFRVTSPPTPRYNCVAWADERTDRFISPVLYDEMLGLYPWPEGIPREDTVEAYTMVLATFGYEVCQSGTLQEGIEKVAIFGHGQVAEHVARQLSSGRWTSKMGQWEDIEHDLEALVGGAYGKVLLFLQRARR